MRQWVTGIRQWVVHRWWAVVLIATVLVFVSVVSQSVLLFTGTLLSSAITIAAATFAVVYGWRSLWKSTPAGRALMYTMISLALFAGQVSLGAWTTLIFQYEQGYPWRLELRVIIYTALAITVSRMIVNLVRIQRRG